MTIETTLGQLMTAEPVLQRLCGQPSLTAKGRYHVVKLLRLVTAEAKHFHEQHQALFQELGVERASENDAERAQYGPTVRQIPPENFGAFRRRLQELCAVPVTVGWAPVKSTELPEATGIEILELGPLCELVDPDLEP